MNGRWKPQPRKYKNGKTVYIARWQDKRGAKRIGWPPDIKGTYALKREAQAAIDQCIERDTNGAQRPDTVGGYFETWTRHHPRSRNTDMTNESRIRAVLDVEIDGVPLRNWPFDSLRVRHGKALADYMLREQGRTYTGANAVLGCLASMCRDAIEDEVAISNPFRDMRKIRANDPRIQKRQRPVRIFSWQDMHRFARACADVTEGTPALVEWRRVHAEAMVRVLSDCGLRIGEVFPLCVSDVNFGEGTLEVRWSLSAGVVLPGTKTDHHELDAGRVVPVPPDLLRMLDGLPKQTIVRRGEVSERALFPKLSHGFWGYSMFRSSVWGPGCESSGMDVRPHEMRHSNISLLRAAGIDPADLAAASGHSVDTATKAYTHSVGRSFDAIKRAVGS